MKTNPLKTFLDAVADRERNAAVGPRTRNRTPSAEQQRELARRAEAEAVQLTERIVRRGRST